MSVSMGVGERQSEDSFVYFGTKPTQRACARFPTRPEEDEERQGPGAVNRRAETATLSKGDA